jgi:hypothetical protein
VKCVNKHQQKATLYHKRFVPTPSVKRQVAQKDVIILGAGGEPCPCAASVVVIVPVVVLDVHDKAVQRVEQ